MQRDYSFSNVLRLIIITSITLVFIQGTILALSCNQWVGLGFGGCLDRNDLFPREVLRIIYWTAPASLGVFILAMIVGFVYRAGKTDTALDSTNNK